MAQTNFSNEAFEALKEYMVNQHGAKLASGGKEITKRCHLCGDSHDISSRHMYIGMKDGVILYNCFKCGSSGLVDAKFFRDMASYDIDMINIVQENNKKNSNSRNLSKMKRILRRSHNFSYQQNQQTQAKLDYINYRLGTQFTYANLASLKITLNLYDFLQDNYVRELTRHESIAQDLNQYFIGFVSHDGNYITMRNIMPDGVVNKYIDQRYVNYNIYGQYDNSGKFYSLRTTVNTMKPIDIHIAEGPFDILGVYFNTDCNKDNSIFISICGKAYLPVIKYLITEYGFINFNLHLYMDNDQTNYEAMKVKNYISLFNAPIYVHRNGMDGEKDYGVPRNRIIDMVQRI